MFFAQIIDDMLWFGKIPSVVAAAAHDGVARVSAAGYVINQQKSILVPARIVPFLGHFVSRLGVTPDVSTWCYVANTCFQLLSSSPALGMRKFLRLCGLLLHVCLSPLARLKLGILYVRFNHLGVLPVTDTLSSTMWRKCWLSLWYHARCLQCPCRVVPR